MAVKALAGFKRIALAPGQTGHVTIEVAPRAFQYWSVVDHNWGNRLGRSHLRRRLLLARHPALDRRRLRRRQRTRPSNVGAGQKVCVAPGARVTDSVTIGAGGSLVAVGAKITGP